MCNAVITVLAILQQLVDLIMNKYKNIPGTLESITVTLQTMTVLK